MISPMEQDHTKKVCSICWSRRPRTEFRRVSIAKGTRHSHCRDCRRSLDQRRKTKHRRGVFINGLREIRRSKSCERIHNLVAGLSAECGGIGVVFEMFVELIMSGTPRDRLRGARTLMFIGAVVDQNAASKLDDPETVIRELHSRGHLLPALRRMYADGTLNDVDPPPFTPPE